VQPDALGSFPYMVVLGFGVVWITLSTLGVIWFATWRSDRRDAPIAPPTVGRRGLTRGRMLGLVTAGLLGGVVIGGAASACASYVAARNAPPRGGGTTQAVP
jgi:hypothetical protein